MALSGDILEAEHGTLELWGGVECTVNRVHQELQEQLHRSGHWDRLSDLDRFAALGITALRQPVLWEHVAPIAIDRADWSWPDKWLTRLKELGIRPIVGLLHHGGGPLYTSLLDPTFPAKLANYAAAVARRYPWVRDYTPVNEPLTTARFSALYGHWYPHASDDVSFVRALLNQCRATVLTMRAIREYQPEARLLQTDDLGSTFSTPELCYQAHFDNERRWLAWDLLCGRVDREHSLYQFLLERGASEAELDWFVENACPPNIIGINHYVTSDRFLDANLHKYPSHAHGGNAQRSYADVEAARVRLDGPAEPWELFFEAWERYRIPLALSEVHHGCTREEQLRWLFEMWRGAERACELGANIRALTIWSLLGAFDWDSLVTLGRNHYEPGAFDIRGPQPRSTAVATLAQQFAKREEPCNPLLQIPGWWRRPERLLYGVAYDENGIRSLIPEGSSPDAHIAPVLITGGRGTLARAFARACVIRGIPHRVLVRGELDIAHTGSVRRAIESYRPWAVINTAGYVRVDDAEFDREACFRENVLGPEILAQECEHRNIRLITFSSDLIFDGSKSAQYIEPDSPAPLNVYGESKLLAEINVLKAYPSALVIRTSAFFGPWDEYNFVYAALRALTENRRFRAAADATVSPTYVPDLVNYSLDLLIDEERGIWHLANRGALTWADLAQRSASLAGLNVSLIDRCDIRDLNLRARRPLFSALASCRTESMPPLDDALNRFMLASNWGCESSVIQTA